MGTRLSAKRWLFLLTALLALGLSGSMAHAQTGQEVQVTFSEFAIAPSTITVRAGETVRFTMVNSGQSRHDLRIEGQGVAFEGLAGNASVEPGQTATAEFVFAAPGTYAMWCPVGQHRERGMEGTFLVVAQSASAAPASSSAAAQPAAAGGPSVVPLIGLLTAVGAGLVGAGVALRRRIGRET